MLEVAFSLRMCCSRACSVRTYPRFAVHVDRLPHDPPGHLADVRHARRQDPEVRPPEVQVVPEGLALRDRDVRPQGSRRRQDPQGGRVEDLDQLSPSGVGRLCEGPDVLQDAEDVRMLDDHGGHVRAHLGRNTAPAVRRREDLRGVAAARPVGPQRGDQPGIDPTGQQHTAPLPRAQHVHRLHEGGGAVVQGRVGDLQLRRARTPSTGTRRGSAARPGRARVGTACRR